MTGAEEPTGAPPVGRLRGAIDAITAGLLTLTAIAALVQAFSGWDPAGRLAVIGLLGAAISGWSRMGRRETLLMLAAAAVAIAAALLTEGSGPRMWAALERSAFLAAFMLLLAVLREGAASSADVEHCGLWLTRQPPSRRYGAIAVGSHFLFLLINIGCLTLLAPLIRTGVRDSERAGDPAEVIEAKARRQYSAQLRGFACAIIWAPTTVTQAVLAAMFPGADATVVLAGGLGWGFLALALGMAEDNLRFRGLSRRMAAQGGGYRRAPLPAPRAALAGLATVCLGLGGVSFALHHAAEVSLVAALMLCAPPLTLGWIYLQGRGRGLSGTEALGATAKRGKRIVTRTTPESAPEAFTLAVSGFIGSVASTLAPPDLIAGAVETLPTWILLAIPPVIMCLGAQLALTPMLFAVFLGTLLAAHPLPVDPALLVLSIGGGWSLAMTCSPFGAGALVLGRASGVPGSTLTWRWNLGYTAMAGAMLVGWLALADVLI